ncbi:hypothetical protein J6590_103741, partial [Homalodisca vitripennis]
VGTHISAPCTTRFGRVSVRARLGYRESTNVHRTVPVKIQTPHFGDGAGTVLPRRRSGVSADISELAGSILLPYDSQHSTDSRVGHGAGMCGPAFNGPKKH